MLKVHVTPGPRCWVGHQRIHHGLTGCVLATAGLLTHHRRLAATGLALMIHDRADWKEWFKTT